MFGNIINKFMSIKINVDKKLQNEKHEKNEKHEENKEYQEYLLDLERYENEGGRCR
jgi:cell shape-determining protein MreC